MAKNQSQVSTIDDGAPETSAAPQAAAAEVAIIAGENHDDTLSGEFEIITIHSTPEDGGGDAVFVSHNGYAYQIPRDKPSKVPREVVQIIRDAKVTGYRSGQAGQVIEETRQRFPFSSQSA